MKLINKFNKAELKENDVLVYEYSNQPSMSDIREIVGSLSDNLPEQLFVVLMQKGDSISMLREKDMNDIGWFRK